MYYTYGFELIEVIIIESKQLIDKDTWRKNIFLHVFCHYYFL